MPYLGATVLIFVTYAVIGLPEGLLGVAWPSMRAYFNVPIGALGLLPVTGTIGYLITSFLSGRLTRKFRIPSLVASGCAVAGLVFIYYTLSPSWYFIVAAGFITGLAMGVIDAGINLFVTQNMGKKQMQWLHACWGTGITMGPFVMTAFLTRMHTWKPAYLLAGALFIMLSAGYILTMRKWGMNRAEIKPAAQGEGAVSLRAAVCRICVIKSMGLFLICSGSEAVLSLWTYSLLTESRGIDPAVAGIIAGFYWMLFTVSRIFAGFYTKYVRANVLIITCILCSFAGIILLWMKLPGFMSIAGVILTGFAIAPVFPAMMSGTRERVGKENEANAVGMQMSAAAVGEALMPAAAGLLAGYFTLEAVPLFLAACLAAFVLLYAGFLKQQS